MIGSENGRSADTYAITSRVERSPPPQPDTRRAPAITAARSSRSGGRSRLLRGIHKVIELRHAIGFRPHADPACVLERLVVPIECLLAVERHREMTALEIDPEGMPLVRWDLHVRALLFRTPTIDRVINRHVVL